MDQTPVAQEKDNADAQIAEWGRSRNEGYKKFRHNMTQPAPLLFTQDHHPLYLADIYRGRSAFLICGGPSFGALDHSHLNKPGIMTMGLNNSPRTFRPKLWASVDSPDHWIRSVWLDPTIMKFVPISHAQKKIFNSDAWTMMDMTVGDCPNVVYYKRNEHFQLNQFLFEDSFNWGNHRKYGGGRSIMLPAIRLLFTLGIRRVYLLGCDLNISPERTYHFDQRRHHGSVRGNQDTYNKLKKWFAELRPIFEANDFHVFNCNPQSELKAFPFIDYKDALQEANSQMDFVDTSVERTRNLYDTETREKEEGTGKDLNWFRLNSPRGMKRCKYCDKKCARVNGDELAPGIIQVTVGCEKSRKALWQQRRGRYHGSMDLIMTPPLPEAEAVAEWNKRFSKDGQ